MTQPVKFLANKTPFLLSVANHQAKKVIDNNIPLDFLVLSSFLPAIFDFFELLLLFAARGSTTL